MLKGCGEFETRAQKPTSPVRSRALKEGTRAPCLTRTVIHILRKTTYEWVMGHSDTSAVRFSFSSGGAARRAALHVAKNCLSESIDGRVPLILGIWGGKGCGKSMNLELCCKRMGVSPIIVSAGELEDQWAGEPGKRLRERYRRAAQVMLTEGKPACLIINDLDAGAGRVKNTTGYTVNTQMVSATLMNLADHPTDVQVGEYWVASHLPRVPIIITANDLSTLYAPLVRDGRMDKFCWHPTRADLAHMVRSWFKHQRPPLKKISVIRNCYEDSYIALASPVLSLSPPHSDPHRAKLPSSRRWARCSPTTASQPLRLKPY